MFKAVYAFLGDDPVRMRERLRSLIEKGVEDPYRAFNLDQFAAGDADPARIAEVCRSYPLGEGRRVVIVRDLAAFPEDQQEAIADLAEELASLPESATTLAVVAPGMDKRRRAYKKLFGIHDLPNGQRLEFDAPKPWKLEGWLSGRASSRGLMLRPGAGQALVELVGDDLEALEAELQKLALFTGGEPVGPEEVETVVGRRRGESPWNLCRLMLTGDGAAAERVLTRLLAAGERPVFLVNALTRQVLEAWQAAILLERGADKKTIIREVGLKPFAADALLEIASAVPISSFPAIVEALKECDLGLKTRGRQEANLLQQVLGRMALVAAGSPAP